MKFVICSTVVLGFTVVVSAQTHRTKVGDEEGPVMRDFRGIGIGMTADEVRKKLGDPSSKSDEQDFFVLGEFETVQVVYDKSHKAIALSFDFSSGAPNIPNPKAVFGSEITPKADGSMYKRVSYTKAGYWLSYNRTAGEQALTSLTFQRIE
jgi:hypothetical protein